LGRLRGGEIGNKGGASRRRFTGDVKSASMHPVRRKRRLEVDEEYEEFDDDTDDMSEDEDFEEFFGNGRGSQRDEQSNIQMLDDDALFGLMKKLVCNSFRQMIASGIGSSGAQIGVPNVGSSRRHTTGYGVSDARVRKAVTRLNVTYFSEIVESLNPQKCKVIESYGFGSLLLFDKCAIPLPFSRWIADQIQVKSCDIVVRNKSIPISVNVVLEIPIGGSSISKSDSDRGKKDFLGALNLTSLPPFKTFGDKLQKDDISDDEVVRSFLIVALATFLCPNSSTYPSTEYLLPLVDVKSAKEWDWSKFVYYWLMK
jgi:hypothetical protein